jgi:hypothetical protein
MHQHSAICTEGIKTQFAKKKWSCIGKVGGEKLLMEIE